LDLNGGRLIRSAPVDTKLGYLVGFWRWVELLEADDYMGALGALYWPRGTSWMPEELKVRVTTFFGGDAPWSVAVPNERLVGAINDASVFEPSNGEGRGWFMAQIPLTTEPEGPKNDEVPLMGLAVSFLVHRLRDDYVLEFEIFHV